MPEKSSGSEDAAAAAPTKPGDLSNCVRAFDAPINTKFAPGKQAPSAAVAGAIADLQREYVVECLRIASVLAGHAADDAELGFDLIGEADLHAALAHFREGARAYRELLQAGGRAP